MGRELAVIREAWTEKTRRTEDTVSAKRLTQQPFLPKLNLTNHMSRKHMRLALVLLFGIVFLAGQFHFCADLTSEPYATHFCPFCAAAGSAILAYAPSIAIIPVLNRLETRTVAVDISFDVPDTTSPRAPPSL